MLQRTFSALEVSNTKFTSKIHLPPTVTKEFDGGNLGCLMNRRWVDTANVQCPIATVRRIV